MSDPGGRTDVIDRLKALKDRAGLAPGIRKQCGELYARLTGPVRVAVAGPPHGGKSTLVNMLAGQRIVPPGASYPTLELCYGETAKTVVTYADGSTAETPGVALEDFEPGELAFVRVEAPLDRLRAINLLEIVADGTAEDQASALNWAIPRIDMALWCAQDFPERDRRIWSRVPDAVKDHSYFILTKADLVAAAGVVSDHIRKLQTHVAEEFRGLYPVSARQAVEAAASGDDAAMRASGGMRLIAELLRDVERGRQANADAGLLFLNHYDPDRKAAANRPVAAAAPAPVPAPERAPEPAKPAAAAPDADVSDAERQLYAEGFEYLRRRARDLSGRLPEGGEIPAHVLGHCMETIEHLVDVFADADTDGPVLRQIQDTVSEASDIVMLLQLEEDVGPAADAVTVLLQLRRDFEARLAA